MRLAAISNIAGSIFSSTSQTAGKPPNGPIGIMSGTIGNILNSVKPILQNLMQSTNTTNLAQNIGNSMIGLGNHFQNNANSLSFLSQQMQTANPFSSSTTNSSQNLLPNQTISNILNTIMRS